MKTVLLTVAICLFYGWPVWSSDTTGQAMTSNSGATTTLQSQEEVWQVLRQASERSAAKWVGLGSISKNKSVAATERGATGSFEELLGILSNKFSAITYRDGDVFWIGDEKRRIELVRASFPEVLSRLVDEYTVTITSTIVPEGEVSVSGDYFLHELIPLLCRRFGVVASYRVGNISFSGNAGDQSAEDGK